LTQQPRLLTSAKPIAPYSNANKRAEGLVILRAILNETGSLQNIEVLHNSGSSRQLSNSAINAARKFRYRTATREGKRVKVSLIIPIDFKK